MEKIVYFDYCALIIFVVLLISTIMRNMVRGKINRIFIALIAVSIITVIGDIFAINLDNTATHFSMIAYISHVVYLAFHNMTTIVYLLYIISSTDSWYMFARKKWRVWAIAIPFCLIEFFVILVNPINGFVFRITSSGVYQRGSGMNLVYMISLGYVILGLSYLYKFRKVFAFRSFVSFFSVFVLMVGAVVLQFLKPYLIVEMFANAIGLLFISMLVQRPEEILDVDTGLNRLSAYVSDIQRSLDIQKPTAIIMINITNYDTINSMLGYEGYKEFLKKVARKLTVINEVERLDAGLYYLGQGKFRIVLERKRIAKAQAVANTLNSVLKKPIKVKEMEIDLLACVCVANCPKEINNIDALLAFGRDLNAKYYNGNLLFAKDIYKKEYYDIVRDMDVIISNALANNRFEVYYQPIFSVEEQRFISAEALLRLKDDRYGFISPEKFIPAAERSGEIHKIGDFVLEEVCRFIKSDEYNKLGIHYIEVNLSVAQCMQNDFARKVVKTLVRYGVSPSQINLEITETAASYAQNTMMDNINKLNQAGIALSLDDFGTGYSNMQRISSMPFHIVKLDKTFAQQIHSEKALIVLQNTVRMIKEMNMKIVVEGIETEQLVQKFSDLKCEYIQGYYYSKPIAKNDFIDFILSNKE